MILDLTELRQDYKSTYKSNWPLAEKIKILIEVTKIEQYTYKVPDCFGYDIIAAKLYFLA